MRPYIVLVKQQLTLEVFTIFKSEVARGVLDTAIQVLIMNKCVYISNFSLTLQKTTIQTIPLRMSRIFNT